MDGGAAGARRSPGPLVGLTLGAMLGSEKEMMPQVSRTLLDIIRDEEPNSGAYKNLIDHHHNKKSWKNLKDRLCLQRVGSVSASDDLLLRNVVSTTYDTVTATATATAAASENNRGPALAQLLRHDSVRVVPVDPAHEDDQFGEVPPAEMRLEQLLNLSLPREVSLQTDITGEESLHVDHVRMSSILRQNSLQIPSSGQSEAPVRSVSLSEALAAEREQIQRVLSSTEIAGRAQDEEELAESDNDNEERDEEGAGAADEPQQVRMSLMDLLEETDRQMGWPSYTRDVDEDNENDDEEAEDGEVEGSNLVERNCCVCMVRHKGSAFIPCGHTFCRLCSRELWVNRGNCPICNGFILEILDIF
ncbi:unnamed protein product [Rhodiola kirilowii]